MTRSLKVEDHAGDFKQGANWHKVNNAVCVIWAMLREMVEYWVWYVVECSMKSSGFHITVVKDVQCGYNTWRVLGLCIVYRYISVADTLDMIPIVSIIKCIMIHIMHLISVIQIYFQINSIQY